MAGLRVACLAAFLACALGGPVGAPGARRLATHVFAKKAAPKSLVVDALADEFYPPPPDKTESLRAAAKGLPA